MTVPGAFAIVLDALTFLGAITMSFLICRGPARIVGHMDRTLESMGTFADSMAIFASMASKGPAVNPVRRRPSLPLSLGNILCVVPHPVLAAGGTRGDGRDGWRHVVEGV